MRIVLIGAESTGLGSALASHLHLDHVQRPEEITSDRFVVDGAPRSLGEARALDAFLRSRASEIDAVLWLGGGDPEVIEHYHGRVVELDLADPLERALAGLREVLLTG